MEVKIGVRNAMRELVVDSAADAAEIEAKLNAALAGNTVLSLLDTKGKTVLVPSEAIAYVEIGSATTPTVGFR